MTTAVREDSQVLDTIQRLRTDYEYWAENLYHIRNKKNELITLRLNYVQKKVGDEEERQLRELGEARIYILKGRQGGISTDQQARSLHKVWGTPGAQAMTLCQSSDDTLKIFMITRRAIQNFDGDLLPSMGRGESKEITFPGLDSYFWTGTAGSKKVGRGLTLNRFHGSEFAFWENPRQVLNQVGPALVPSGSVIVLETTPDAFESEAHKFWKEAKDGLNGYVALFFPWWVCDIPNYRLPLFNATELDPLDEEEQLLISKEGLDHEQIKWRRKKIREMGKLEFLREYPEDDETCWITAGQKFYNVEIIQRLLRKAPKPIKIETTKYGPLVIYGSPVVEQTFPNGLKGLVSEKVVIGCDTSEGLGADSHAWVARSWPSWRLLSQYKNAKLDPTILGDMLVDWGWMYDEALLVIEKNMHGITVLRRIRDKKYPRRSIYHRTPLDKMHDQKTEYIGWATTSESKPILLDAGREILQAADEGLIEVPSRECLIDFLGVVDGELTGKDVLVGEMLSWIGREYIARYKVAPMAPLHWG